MYIYVLNSIDIYEIKIVRNLRICRNNCFVCNLIELENNKSRNNRIIEIIME